ncbi:hypothetical protein [Halobacillus naozhouensis]|uniref:YpzG-like protein n=1 Tax=Halobacillus naozhouensis TaxID=554880 RepID=A0ABY8J5G5_9BACI|nr:hypothetical protein [Halobacillus naozhouensis]WFT76196.1 hypothetical protein P9989_07480 [Halobacillus naozhouensis]
MGYILPINHYQYMDYKKRVTQTARSPFVLDAVFKATLDQKLQGNEHQQQEQQEKDVKNERFHPLYTPATIHYHTVPQTENISEKVYSNVTGKGLHFSEKV